MLCVTTYINHGLLANQDFETSVRSKIKRILIPEIMNSKRIKRSSSGGNQRREDGGNIDDSNISALQTLCTFSNSEVLCSVNNRNSRTRRTIHSEGSGDDTTSPANRIEPTHRPRGSIRESIEEIGEDLLNVIEEAKQETVRNIQRQLDRWTNHERSSVATTSIPLTITTTSEAVTTHGHQLSDHEVISGDESQQPSELTREGYHDAGCSPGYCRAGICHYDSIFRHSVCL